MKWKTLLIIMIITLALGCSKQESTIEQKSNEPTLAKGTIELLVSSTELSDYDSIGVSFNSIKIIQGENEIDLTLSTEAIELVALSENKIYGLFQTSMNVGDYNKIELSIKEIKAYKDGKEVTLTGDKLLLEKSFTIAGGENTRFVFDIKLEDTTLVANNADSGIIGTDILEVSEMKKDNIKVIGAKEVTKSKTDLEDNTNQEKSDIDENSTLSAKELLGQPKTHEVTLNAGTANPEVITIRAGDTISWNNIGKSTHRLYAKKPFNFFRSDILMPGDLFNVTFEEKGEYLYTSAAYASYMKNTKVVVE